MDDLVDENGKGEAGEGKRISESNARQAAVPCTPAPLILLDLQVVKRALEMPGDDHHYSE
jgi:hypothetical protein